VLVLPGTIMRQGAVAGARTVVDGEVSAWSVVAGNPIKSCGRRQWRVNNSNTDIANQATQ